ncbi:iron dicitrate transport regulator FecR [Echinicola strongylocentroti]|uniref:Iron dicitrate transport regulator FecR n=1 Tax=Echinicola strongylocentroti TaxID=1795355 RepID=A0A2Z4IQY2_9BACT|nr:FecR domain-containing protein [Echinicola strongylocentroti]AWW32966.1 iron dicitrate transport regulator FecR [Echinicola strongylocentroti]
MEDHKLLRYFEGKASEEETKEIIQWLNADEANESYFHQQKAQYVASKFSETSNEVDVDRKWDSFRDHLNPGPASFSRSITWRYAAAVIMVLGIGYLFYTFQFAAEQASPVPAENMITLKLGDGKVVAIDELSDLPIINEAGKIIGNQIGSKLSYLVHDADGTTDQLSYNTLTVPYAKRFEIILPDSTHVTLNAGSSLTYPTSFDNMDTRSVTLIGEAYFNVREDKSLPFIVNADQMNIRVLGTQFNVSSYPEDELVQTALVEGKVSIYDDRKPYAPAASSTLSPGQLATWNKADNEVQIKETPLDMYTAWLSGKIIFKNVPFQNIIKKLERHYDVDIVNLDGTFNNEYYTASFDVESIEEVMETFKRAYGLHYQIEGNKITIHH